jgi:hypothetical protein
MIEFDLTDVLFVDRGAAHSVDLTAYKADAIYVVGPNGVIAIPIKDRPVELVFLG